MAIQGTPLGECCFPSLLRCALFLNSCAMGAAGPPEQPVKNLKVLRYDETAVTLSWEQPGNSTGSGPAATHFAVLYSCGGAALALYPGTFTALQATLAPAGGWTIGSTCDFQVASRNFNYNISNPWSGQRSTILRATLQGLALHQS